jgi:hypothetical protein
MGVSRTSLLVAGTWRTWDANGIRPRDLPAPNPTFRVRDCYWNRMLETKFANKDAEVTLANVLAVQRGYLKAAETWLDARYEVSLAEADLALATAEAALALGPPPPAAKGPERVTPSK